MIGVGESDTENRAVECVEKALSNPLLDVDATGANGALINVCGGPSMTLDEARKVVGVPDNYRIVTVMPLGFPRLPGREKTRKSLDEIVCYETFKE